MAKGDASIVRTITIPASWAREALARLGVAGTEATGDPHEIILLRQGNTWTCEARWPAKVINGEAEMKRRVLHERLKAARARDRGETT